MPQLLHPGAEPPRLPTDLGGTTVYPAKVTSTTCCLKTLSVGVGSCYLACSTAEDKMNITFANKSVDTNRKISE